MTATTATTIPMHTFLFFHHILFFTFLDVSRISNDWSANVSAFFTIISIFWPLSIILSKLFKAIYSASFNYLRALNNLSTSALLLYFPIHYCKIGLKSFRLWATAWFLLVISYLLKKLSCIFLRKSTAILV